MRSLTTILFLLGLVTLVSCGAQKSVTTLQVSSGMLLSNNSYQGGLVFYGRSSTGQFFSAPVPFTATASTNQVEVSLDKGTWTFAAIGWAGSGSGINDLTGSLKCALQSDVVIDADTKTVNLTLNVTDCSLSEFNGSANLNLATCGTLYTNLSTSAAVSSTTGLDYCTTNSNIPPDFKNHAKSAMVSIPVLIPGQAPTPSPLHFCLDLTDGYTATTPSSKITKSGLPLLIELFETSCADSTPRISNRFEFFSGASASPTTFDSFYKDNSSSVNLFLLNNKSRRGQTLFADSLPEFRCNNSNPCIYFPSVPNVGSSATDLYVEPDLDFKFKSVSSGDSCTNIDSSHLSNITIALASGTSPTISAGTVNCSIKDGDVRIRLTKAAFPACASPPCLLTLKLKLDGTNLTTKSLSYSLNQPSYRAHELLLGVLGYQDFFILNSTSNITTKVTDSLYGVFQSDQSEIKNFGLLSLPRELLGPGVLGGLFEASTLSELDNKVITVSTFEDGQLKIFKIKSEAATASDPIPAAIAGTFSYFTHKITISELKSGSYVVKSILKIKDSHKIGMLEDKDVKIDPITADKTVERSLLFWNTESITSSLVEKYSIETTLSNTTPAVELEKKSNFTQLTADSTSGDAKIFDNSFESSKQNTIYVDKTIKRSLSLVGSRAIYSENSAEFNQSSSAGEIFTKPLLKKYLGSQSVSERVAFAKSPNGQNRVWAWSHKISGTNLTHDLRVVSKTASGTQVHSLAVGSNIPFIPKVTVNNAGEITLAFVKQTGTTPSYYIYAMVWDALNGTPVWKNSDNTNISGTFNPIVTSSTPIPFDLVDDNPAASGTNSSKKIVLYGSFVTSTNFKKIIYDRGQTNPWSSVSTLTTNSPEAGTTMNSFKLVKAQAGTSANDYYLIWINSGTAATHYLKSVKIQPDNTGSPLAGTVGSTSTAPLTMTAASNSKFFTDFDPSSSNTSQSLKLYVLNVNDNSKLYEGTFNGSNLNVNSTSIGSNYKLNLEGEPYCFVRNTTSVNNLGSSNLFGTDTACNDSTFMPSQPIINNYKFDLETLNPSVLNPSNSSIFSIP